MNKRATVGAGLIVALALCCAPRVTRANPNYQTLPHTFTFTQFENVIASHDWSRVPGMEGFQGTNLVTSEGIDPRTILIDSPSENADEYCCTLWSIWAGVAINRYASPMNPWGFPGLRGASSFYSKFAPHLRYYVNAKNCFGIRVSFKLFDTDSLAASGDVTEPFSLQYRTAPGQPWVDVPDAYVADATAPPGQPKLVTRRTVLLPPAVDGQPNLQLRILTTDSPGADEWVGVDSVVVSAAGSLSLQPDSLGARFAAGINPGDASIILRNERIPGYPDFGWQVAPATGTWLSCLPATGVLVSGDSATIALQYSTAALTPGTYSTMVRVFPAGQPTLVADSLRVTVIVGPEIAVTLAGIALTIPRPGQDSASIAIADLRYGGTGGLVWTLTDGWAANQADCPWLSEPVNHGVILDGAPHEVRVIANTAAIQRGSYVANLKVASNDPEHPVVTVPVSLLVTQASASPPSQLTLGAVQGTTRIDSTTFVIANSGFMTTLNWSIDVPLTPSLAKHGTGIRSQLTTCPGLTAAENSGSVPAGGSVKVRLTLDGTGLPLGDQSCEIHLTSNDTDRPAITIPVTLRVLTVLAVPVSGDALQWRLDSPLPNPASSATHISFALPRSAHVELALFDVGGARVRTLAAGSFAAGSHSVECVTSGLGAGLYFVRMSAGAFQTSTRLLVVH